MSLFKAVGVVGLGLLVFGASESRANEKVEAVETVANQSTATGFKGGKIKASLESRFFGPSLANINSSLRPDLNTGKPNPRTPLKADTNLYVSYRLPKVGLGVGVTTELLTVQSHDLTFKDPQVFVKGNKLITAENFSLDGFVRFFPGVSASSRSYDQIASIRFDQLSNYRFANSRWSLNSYAFVQPVFYNTLSKGSRDYKLFLLGGADYKISSNLSANFTWKKWMSHTPGNPLFDINGDLTLAGPGLSYNVLPNLSLSPYVDFSLGTRVAADTTTVGMFLWWGII